MAIKKEELRHFMRQLAEASGKVVRQHFFDFNLLVESKGDKTPVTQADRQAEEVMRDLIRREYPGHGIIGEEYGNENETADYVWVLDPIDGTLSYASGCPLFGTLACLLHEGQPILGAISQPVLDLFCMGDNDETTVNGRPVRVREVERLSDATVLTTDVLAVAKYNAGGGFDKLMRQARLFRTWGDCYGYLLLASGWADVMLDPVMNPWDLLPLVPIIQGAGGVITSWDGSSAVRADSCVAAGKKLHPRVLVILNE